MSIPLENIDQSQNETKSVAVEEITIIESFRNGLRQIRNELKEICTPNPREWINGFRYNSNYPLFVKGDIDGFVALFINTIATLLAVILSLQPILGNEIVYGKIVPG